ncbi:MAG: histidine phosphotransferase, partial [Alphaproteobacteria bacterium]
MSATRLAAMLCSRLCHDLVSPVGALVNGVEILGEEDDPDMRAQVLDFLGQSAEQTSARLQFFRLAFGGGAGFGNEVDPEEGRKALAALLGDGKVRLDWATNGARIDKTLLKLVLNLALIAAESLIRGGTLTVRIGSADSESPLEIEASGERLILSDEMRLALAGRMPAERIEPRTAPAFLAALLAADLGMDIALTDSA